MKTLVALSLFLIVASFTDGQTFTEYPINTGGRQYLSAISIAPDGTVWLGDASGPKVWRRTPDGIISSFEWAPPPGSAPWVQHLTVHPNGSLYFVHNGVFGRVDPNGNLSLAPGGGGVSICVGPDGNLWMAGGGQGLGWFAPDMTEGGSYSVPNPDALINSITAGPDGAIWYTDAVRGLVGRITTDLVVTGEYFLGIASGPSEIVTGPDGNLWVTDLNARLFRITPGGTVASLGSPASLGMRRLASDGQNGLWFTGSYAGLGHYDIPSGQVIQFPRANYPEDIAVAPDGSIWFTETYAGVDGIGPRLVRMVLAPLAVPIPALSRLGIGACVMLLLAAGCWRLRRKRLGSALWPGLVITIVFGFSATEAAAQVPFAPADKTVDRDLAPGTPVRSVVLKFHEGTHVRLRDGQLVTENRSSEDRQVLAGASPYA